jgi:hypothetical protein
MLYIAGSISHQANAGGREGKLEKLISRKDLLRVIAAARRDTTPETTHAARHSARFAD